MINFYSENDFVLDNETKVKDWIESTIHSEEYKLDELSFIFCDDEYLHKINLQFLNHDTLTDIITFDYNVGKLINGEIYISTERVEENSKEFKAKFTDELLRVIIHGVLHLCGLKDKSEAEQQIMRKAEDKYLSIYFS